MLMGGVFNASELNRCMPHPGSRGNWILEMMVRAGFVILNHSTPRWRNPCIAFIFVISGAVASARELLEKQREVVDAFSLPTLAQRSLCVWNVASVKITKGCPFFTMEELKEKVFSMKNRKAAWIWQYSGGHMQTGISPQQTYYSSYSPRAIRRIFYLSLEGGETHAGQ